MIFNFSVVPEQATIMASGSRHRKILEKLTYSNLI